LQGRLTKEDVDLRMIKALADLPGDRGMEAVDRFSGSSLETVRSKTGFMVRRSSRFPALGTSFGT